MSAFLTKTVTDAGNAFWDVIKDQTFLAAGQQRARQPEKSHCFISNAEAPCEHNLFLSFQKAILLFLLLKLAVLCRAKSLHSLTSFYGVEIIARKKLCIIKEDLSFCSRLNAAMERRGDVGER